MFKTKRLYCVRCRTSQLHAVVGDGSGGLRWKCPNCGLTCDGMSEEKKPLHGIPEQMDPEEIPMWDRETWNS